MSFFLGHVSERRTAQRYTGCPRRLYIWVPALKSQNFRDKVCNLLRKAVFSFQSQTYRLSREQTVQYARKHMVTSDTLDFADVQPNDLDLLLSNLSSVVSEPRHLDVYSIARKLIITDQQRQFAQLAPQRAEARIVLLVPAKKSIGFEIAGGIERNLPIYCKEVTFQTVRKSEYNPQGYRYVLFNPDVY